MQWNRQLRDATVQEIQLELIRRTKHNAFDGERIFASLIKHRHLWAAVMLDRVGLIRTGGLPAMDLIKLRDLNENIWNADTLYILTTVPEDAKELAKIIKIEQWGGELYVFDDHEVVDDALGGAEDGQCVVRIWWD